MLIMRTTFVNVLILYAKHILCSSILLPFAALLLIWEMMLHKSPTLFTFLLKVWNPKSSFKYVWAIVHHCRWQRRLPRQLTQHCTWPLASISTNPCSRTTKRVIIMLLLNPSTHRTTLGPCPWTLILHNKCLISSSRSITTTKKANMILPKKHRSPRQGQASGVLQMWQAWPHEKRLQSASEPRVWRETWLRVSFWAAGVKAGCIHHHHHSGYPSSQTEPDGRLTLNPGLSKKEPKSKCSYCKQQKHNHRAKQNNTLFTVYMGYIQVQHTIAIYQ